MRTLKGDYLAACFFSAEMTGKIKFDRVQKIDQLNKVVAECWSTETLVTTFQNLNLNEIVG